MRSIALKAAVCAGAAALLSTTGLSPLPASADDVACVREAADQAAAAALAAACDHEVEVLEARSPWDTLVAQPQGGMRLDVSSTAVRAQVDGKWVGIDTDVIAGAGGMIVESPVNPMTFSDGSGTPLATIERDGHKLTFDVPFDLPRPSVAGAQLTYEDVLPDVDLIVTVNSDATGFAEVLRVATPEAAGHPGIRELAFPVAVSDGLSLVEHAGGFVARDASERDIFSSPTPVMWDSAEPVPAARMQPALTGILASLRLAQRAAEQTVGTAVGGRNVAPVGGEQVEVLPVDLVDDTVQITPDVDLLTDPSTVWPVYIDPSIDGSRQDWTAIQDGYPQKYRFDPDQGAGMCQYGLASSGCPKTYKSRLKWRFGGLDTIGALDGGNITSATFRVFGTHSYDCTPSTVSVYRTDDFSSATNWEGAGGLWHIQGSQTVAHKPACAAHPARWLEFPVLEAVQAVANANTNVLALGMAGDESTGRGWKRYRNDATLSIAFNRVPNAPANVSFTDPAAGCVMGDNRPWLRMNNPVLTATLSDPDGDPVQANMDVYLAGTNTMLSHTRPAAQGSGAVHSLRLPPVADGGTYRVQMNGVDNSVWGGPHVQCEFGVDLTPPTTPEVAPDTANPGVYIENAIGGGIGKGGMFHFKAGASTDVTKFMYSFNSDALNSEAKATAGAASIYFWPKVEGPHTLNVISVDRAGWPSFKRSYSFRVASPTEVGHWVLNEGESGPTGTTHADSGLGNRYPLRSSPDTGRTPGLWTELGIATEDKALDFTNDTARANSTGPVVNTAGSYTVMARVKPSGGVSSGTVVSQDGAKASEFELGIISSATGDCPAGMSRCWAFTKRTGGGATAPVRVTSSVPVRDDEWVYLAGTYNAESVIKRTTRLAVCHIGSVPLGNVVENPTVSITQKAWPSGFVVQWQATGTLQIGRGRDVSQLAPGGAPTNFWRGAVDEVWVVDNTVSAEDLQRACTAAP